MENADNKKSKREKLFKINNLCAEKKFTDLKKESGLDFKTEKNDGKPFKENYAVYIIVTSCVNRWKLKLISDEVLYNDSFFNLIVRCLAEDGSASAADYYLLGKEIMRGEHFVKNLRTAKRVVHIAARRHYMPAFSLYLRIGAEQSNYHDWDSIYDDYYEMRDKGMEDSLLMVLPQELHDIIVIKKQANEEKNKDAILKVQAHNQIWKPQNFLWCMQ